MNTGRLRFGLLLGAALVTVAYGFTRNPGAKPQSPNTSLPVTVEPNLGTPPAPGTLSQDVVNNFAWQSFIALNWRADSQNCGTPDPKIDASQFGAPNDTAPVVWESYKDASEVFLPGGKAPTGWCSDQGVPTALRHLARGAALQKTSPFGYKMLSLTSEVSGNQSLKLNSIQQATGGWLTAQSGNITLYEVRINQDEFNFIKAPANKLYNAANQLPMVQSTNGFNLPDGGPLYTSYGTTGSIETKASWIELDDPKQWPYFKTSKAYVIYPGSKTPKLVTVGLVGLHIIRKIPAAQQFIWATFEHVNNCPSVLDVRRKSYLPWYTYFNPACDPSTDHYACRFNNNYVPPTAPRDPYNAPIQLERINLIDSFASNENQQAWTAIGKANPNSVFLNYQLVNVLWPNGNTTIEANAPTPLTTGNATPPLPVVVANTTMETYAQNQFNCLSCHTGAPIASTSGKALVRITPPVRSANTRPTPSPSSGSSPTYASDYSFLFSRAKTSGK